MSSRASKRARLGRAKVSELSRAQEEARKLLGGTATAKFQPRAPAGRRYTIGINLGKGLVGVVGDGSSWEEALQNTKSRLEKQAVQEAVQQQPADLEK